MRDKKTEYIADIPPKKFAERVRKLIKDGLIEPSNDKRYFKFTPSFRKLVDDCTKKYMAKQHELDGIDKKRGKPPGTTDAIGMGVIEAYLKTIKQGRLEDAEVDGDILLLIRISQVIKPTNHFPDGLPPKHSGDELG